MEKEFILYEQALELKQLGFDEPCFGWYDGKYTSSINQDYCKNSEEWLNTIHCAAPLYQQAFRWFREKHRLASWVYNSDLNVFFYTILKNGRIIKGHDKFNIYEEAELACLIKLIEIIKKKL
jgi:hypothetical protein